ncbi:MAG: hypothetical protein GVY17_02420 [Cyanobacteria bacterium]|jgi:hypothetical protein|nr:hypothetical protein [Cyanobacteria bacterium GSL.Bin21]
MTTGLSWNCYWSYVTSSKPAILILDFSGIVETIISSEEPVSGWQNDVFDLGSHFKRENHSHTENCCIEAGNSIDSGIPAIIDLI